MVIFIGYIYIIQLYSYLVCNRDEVERGGEQEDRDGRGRRGGEVER
jgi:hypothetical protein